MSLALTEKQTWEIEALCQIARENGTAISLRELLGLAAIDASEDQLEGAFLSDSNLCSKFLLESGFVLDRSLVAERGTLQIVEEERRRRERAGANLVSASRFGRLLTKGTVFVSVSGANSYLAARKNEDIDYFCVTKTNGMWPFILKTLIMARIHRLANKDVPELCFSCVMDEKWAIQAFMARQPPIFARDALTAKIIDGKDAYHRLLRQASWMEDYFPAFYRVRLRETGLDGTEGSRSNGAGNGSSVVLNSFLYHIVGSFLRLKSWALNRKLTKAARHSSIFKIRIGTGHFIYESNRYRNLRAIYEELVEENSEENLKEGDTQDLAWDENEVGAPQIEPGTMKIVTRGRASGLPHVALVRFAFSEGAYLAMGAGRKSDWFLNALASRSGKVKDGDSIQAVACEEFHDIDLVRRLFTKKYGAAVVKEWYSGPEIRSVKLTPTATSALGTVVGGEHKANVGFQT